MTPSMIARLMGIARALCGAAATAAVFEPLLADWQQEYASAAGARRRRVLVLGGCAFARSVWQCLDLRIVAAKRPAASFTGALLLFAGVATAFAAAPVFIQWRHWDPLHTSVVWRWPTLLTLYLAPGLAGSAIALALLPATILGAAERPARRCLLGIGSALLAILLIEGWVTPAAHDAYSREFWSARGRPERAAYASPNFRLNDYIARSQDSRPEVARDAWLELNRKAALLASGIGFATLGIALARARRSSAAALRVATLAGWWIFAAVSYGTLSYWSRYFVPAMELPTVVTPWLPAGVLLLIGGVAAAAPTGSDQASRSA